MSPSPDRALYSNIVTDQTPFHRFSPMFETVGVARSSAIGCTLVFAVSVVPTAILQWRGALWRRNTEKEN